MTQKQPSSAKGIGCAILIAALMAYGVYKEKHKTTGDKIREAREAINEEATREICKDYRRRNLPPPSDVKC